VFETKKESFDEISAFIAMPIKEPILSTVRPGRDDGFCTDALNLLQQMVGVECLVGDDGADLGQGVDEIGRLGDVITLTSSQPEAAEVAQTVDGSVNLGTQSPTRTAKTLLPLFFEAPAACWCARTMVLSRNTSSKSASSDSLAKMACQTPLSAQREKRLKTVFHGPNPAGRSRQGTPVRAIQRTASTNKRLSAPVRPRSPALPCSNGSMRPHWSSRSSNLGILSSAQKTECEHISAFVNWGLPSNVHSL
jgi:hypothetical protein